MKSLHSTIIQCALLLGTLSLAACGASTGGTSTGGTSTTAPTTPPKSKPTALPTITTAYCQGILTLAEANQIMQPAAPATNIRIDALKAGGGSCNYEYAPYKAVVSVEFLVAIPASEQGQPLSGHIPANMPGIVMNTPVSGVGDQAQYVATSNQINGQTVNLNTLDVIYGAILFNCDRPYNGPSQATAEQAPLTNVCQLVISRL